MDGMIDQEQFLRLLLRHEADLKAFIGSLVPDRHARDDVFQEVALALWRAADAYDPARPFGAWARGVAANTILQQRQQGARFPLAFSPAAIAAIRDAYDRTEAAAAAATTPRAEALRECVDRLPAKSRELLALRYEHALDAAEIARRLGRTLDAVYQALSRLRAALEECVRRRLRGEEGGGAA